MARPSKSVNVMSKNLTKEEIRVRQQAESRLKGRGDKIKPPTDLTITQKAIFKKIVEDLKEADILSNLDIPLLVTCSRAIDRLNYIERQINEDMDLLFNSSFMSSKDKYTKDLYRCCNELCLSPQSRAKMGNIAIENEKEKSDPLLAIIGGRNG